MYEIDFLPVGDGERSGDAIAVRFTRPDTGRHAVMIIDGGFQDDGDALVEHVQEWYGTSYVDLVVSTHPDGDHIGGMGRLMRRLHVGTLWIHRPTLHGYPGNSGAEPSEELVTLAAAQGTQVAEPFTGMSGFGGALTVAAPTGAWYEQMLAEQAVTAKTASVPSFGARLAEGAVRLARRALDALPVETLYDDDGGTNPRNNSATVLDLAVDGRRFLFTSDVGVPALHHAADYLEASGRTAIELHFIQGLHHGSRHNVDRNILDRLLGSAGQAPWRTAYISATENAPKHPHPKVTNAMMRRGCSVYTNERGAIHHHSPDAPDRGWPPLAPLPPRDESDD